jgi:hypothetical protein
MVDVDEEFLYVVDYKQLPFTADEIVARARTLKGYRAYDMFTNNCEHIALWCVAMHTLLWELTMQLKL